MHHLSDDYQHHLHYDRVVSPAMTRCRVNFRILLGFQLLTLVITWGLFYTGWEPPEALHAEFQLLALFLGLAPITFPVAIVVSAARNRIACQKCGFPIFVTLVLALVQLFVFLPLCQ